MFSYFGKRKLAKMWQLVCNGKTKHGWITGAHMFSKKRIFTAKNQAILRLCLFLVLRFVKFCSAQFRRAANQNQANSFHARRPIIIPASSVHIHFDRRSNTLQRGHEAT